MALQHHFVLVVEDGKISFDFDTSINYDAGEIWDTEAETWLIRGDDNDLYDAYEEAFKVLARVIESQPVATA
jgi:hypothetical protein